MLIALLIVVLVVVAIGVHRWRTSRAQPGAPAARPGATAGGARGDPRGDAYFQAMFPELQPWFHPQSVLDFVRMRIAAAGDATTFDWPGHVGVKAFVVRDAGRERVDLVEAGGATRAQFDYETQPSGAALRVGRGKLTAVLEDAADPRVRYWHPEREFKWSTRRGWQFVTPVADQPFDSRDTGSSFQDRDSRAGSSIPAAVIAGAGGAFAGAGASAAWDARNAAGGDDGSNATGGSAAGSDALAAAAGLSSIGAGSTSY